MDKTKLTLAQQTYEKVCAIETILNSLLADSSPPVSERPPLSGDGRPPRCLSRSSGWRTLPTICLVSTRPTCCMVSPVCPSS